MDLNKKAQEKQMALDTYRNISTDGNVISYIHGSRSELLTQDKYTSLKQCESLDDLRLKLKPTAYGPFLFENSSLTVSVIKNALYKGMLRSLDYIYSISSPRARTVVDFFRDLHRINTFLYLWACKRESPETVAELFEECSPLGLYEELSFIKVTQGPEDTWKFCIENTPLSKYTSGIRTDLLSEEIQFIGAVFYKRYLETLYKYSVGHKLFLEEFCRFEGDKRIIELVSATLETEMKASDKMELFPECTSFGKGALASLAMCTTYDELKGYLSSESGYREIVSSEAGFEEALRRKEVEMCMKAFFFYDDVSVVYTYFKIQELEIRNLIYAAECISQGKGQEIEGVFN
jgi:V-type H+-transporting ATPase subunit d